MLGALCISQIPGSGTGEQSGCELNTDNQAHDQRTHLQHIVYMQGQYGQGQPDT